MADKEPVEEIASGDEEEIDEDGGGIMYVRQKIYNELKAKLKDSKDIATKDVEDLVAVEGIPDDENMVPVDMTAVGEPFEDVEQMLTKLGPKPAAEAFIKARELFEKNEDGEPEDERPKEMTAKEWREVLEEEDMLEEGEEEFMDIEAGESEFDDLDLEDEEAEEGDDDDDAAEPPAKKAKAS